MIEIIGNDNRHVAEAATLEDAMAALAVLVPEEREDLRAVAEGQVLAVGFFKPLHLVPRQLSPGERLIEGEVRYSAAWLDD